MLLLRSPFLRYWLPLLPRNKYEPRRRAKPITSSPRANGGAWHWPANITSLLAIASHCTPSSSLERPSTSSVVPKGQRIIMERRSTRRSNSRIPGSSRASQKSEEGEDVLAELLGILARGKSQWYTLNGNTNTTVSLCKVLGFYSEMDYYGLLVSKNLAAYRMNRKNKTNGDNNSKGKLDKLFIQF